MARRTLLIHALVALLSSAPCRGDRRQLEIVEENETGLSATVASSRQEAYTNTTASLAVQGQAVSSSAAKAASLSARSATNSSVFVAADASANGSSAQQRDQPSEHGDSSTSQREESRDVLASNLTAATVQAHAALAHAVSALAEQQARKTLELKNESESKSSAEGETKEGETKEGETAETEKLQQEEKSALGGGLGSLATAMSDPREFLMGLDTIKTFSAAMRAAIEHGGEGKCLAAGEFAGYGCGDDKDMPKICSCRHMYELCWLPDDPNKVVKNFPGQAALDEAKALLFGKCYTSYLLIAAIGIGCLLVLAVVAYCLKGIFKKNTPS